MRANSTLESQIQVVHEKDSILREKTHRAESSQSAMTELIEQQRAEIVKFKLENRNLMASKRFQRRIRKWVQPLIESLYGKIEDLKNSVSAKNAVVSDLRALLRDRDEELQANERGYVRDQAKLVEQYEKDQKALSHELEKQLLEQRPLRERAALVEQAVKNEASSQNKIVLLERKIQEMQAERDKFRKESKTLAAEALSGKKETATLGDDLAKIKEELAMTKDQFESLQIVWGEAQKRLESSKTQLDTLNRLNQELSRQLSDQRATVKSQSLLSKDCEM